MPTALVLTLRPKRRATVAASLGSAAHAAILEQIAAVDGALAAAIHDPQGIRPITVSPVLGLDRHGPQASVTPEQTYHLRVTLLAPALEQLVERWTERPLTQLVLGNLGWQVEQVATAPEQHPLAERLSYAQLLAGVGQAGAAAPAPRWYFTFITPVMFRRRHQCLPLPTPELVFGSLLERWNALAPLPLSDDVREFVAASLVMNDFNLRSVAMAGKGGVPQIGATGSCTYAVTGRDAYQEACVALLAQFARFSGIGAGTARGFGQVYSRQGSSRNHTPPTRQRKGYHHVEAPGP